MSYKYSILELAPRWLTGRVGGALLRTFGRMLDNLNEQLRDGIKARFPAYAPDDLALSYIGNDRSIERGLVETSDHYRDRLVGARTSNKRRGSGPELLRQLAGFFSGADDPPLRLVSNDAVWFEYNWTTGEVEKTIDGTNWNWDGDTTSWWRGWVIIDCSSGPWGPGLEFGDPDGGVFGDDAIFGTDAPIAELQALQRIVQKWKPANVYCVRIILTFDPSLFEVTDPAGADNPNGDFADPANRPAAAVFILSGGEEP